MEDVAFTTVEAGKLRDAPKQSKGRFDACHTLCCPWLSLLRNGTV